MRLARLEDIGFPVETRLAASPAVNETMQARRGKPRLYRSKDARGKRKNGNGI